VKSYSCPGCHHPIDPMQEVVAKLCFDRYVWRCSRACWRTSTLRKPHV
jgi:hypothetical protein